MKKIYKTPLVWAENEAYSFPLKCFKNIKNKGNGNIKVIAYDWDNEIVYVETDISEDCEAAYLAIGCEESTKTKNDLTKLYKKRTKETLKESRQNKVIKDDIHGKTLDPELE